MPSFTGGFRCPFPDAHFRQPSEKFGASDESTLGKMEGEIAGQKAFQMVYKSLVRRLCDRFVGVSITSEVSQPNKD
jgi:hypothetical protein